MFSEQQKLFLFELVTSQKRIFLCPKIDRVSNRQKNEAWAQVAQEFNRRFREATPRTVASLKVLYGDLKQKTRQGVAETNVICISVSITYF
nr:unnamed protein product [Callosobruchus analis]